MIVEPRSHELEDIVAAPAWTWISLGCYGPVAAVSVAWILLQHGTQTLTERVLGTAPLQGAAVGVGAGLGVVLLSRWLTRAWPAAQRMEETFTRWLGPLTAGHCFWLAAGSAVGEELLFRATLQPAWGLLPTALVFGLLHLPFERTLLPWTPFAILMGLWLGWLYQATGTLTAPVVTHFLINWLNLLRMRRLAAG